MAELNAELEASRRERAERQAKWEAEQAERQQKWEAERLEREQKRTDSTSSNAPAVAAQSFGPAPAAPEVGLTITSRMKGRAGISAASTATAPALMMKSTITRTTTTTTTMRATTTTRRSSGRRNA